MPQARAGQTARFVIALASVAIGAAGFASAFRASLSGAYHLAYGANSVLDAMRQLSAPVRLLPLAAGALVAGLLTRGAAPRRQNASNVMEAVALGRVQLSMQVTAIRVAGSESFHNRSHSTAPLGR